MIIYNILNHVLISKSNLKVLRVLNTLVVGVSGRETARLANISLRAVQLALQNLEAIHIVKKEPGGRENKFILNRKNYVVKNIINKIFLEEKKYRRNIFQKIEKSLKEITESVILFGSVARNEETTISDYDICILFNKGKGEIEKRVRKLRHELNEEYGIFLSPFYISKKEFQKRINNKKPPVQSIIEEGIVISGLSINWLKHENKLSSKKGK